MQAYKVEFFQSRFEPESDLRKVFLDKDQALEYAVDVVCVVDPDVDVCYQQGPRGWVVSYFDKDGQETVCGSVEQLVVVER